MSVSHKIYVDGPHGIRVPMRQIHLTDGTDFRVYDASGVHTDPGIEVDARATRYLMLNAPDGSLDSIVDLLPGLDSPTVLPLAAAGMHAVHAVVPRDQVIELLSPLRAAGARSLLVLPIDNLIP